MKYHGIVVVLSGLLAASVMAGEDTSALTGEARTIAAGVLANFNAEISRGLDQGDLPQVFGVCRFLVPLIADEAAKISGWRVSWISFEQRDPRHRPDSWEAAALEAFAARGTTGEAVRGMEQGEVFERHGRQTFRYVQAVETTPACLACHGGGEVTPEARAQMKALHAVRAARGLNDGDLHGAISLSKDLRTVLPQKGE